jgi:hypothetical protein
MKRSSLAFACALAFAGSSARAEEARPRVALTWVAPSSCPSAQAIQSQIESALERANNGNGHVVARAIVTSDESRWHLTLAIESEHTSGTRTLDADSCEAIAGAVVLIAVLATEPVEVTAPTPTPSAAADTNAEAIPEDDRKKLPSTSGKRAVHVGLGAEGASDIGSLPSIAGGGRLSLFATYRRARLEAIATMWGKQNAFVAGSSTEGVNLFFLTAGGHACYAVLSNDESASRGLSLSPCAGTEWNRMASGGFGGPSAFANVTEWASVHAGALGSWNLFSFLSLRAAIEAVVPLARPTFVTLDDTGAIANTLHRPSVVGARGLAGVEARF